MHATCFQKREQYCNNDRGTSSAKQAEIRTEGVKTDAVSVKRADLRTEGLGNTTMDRNKIHKLTAEAIDLLREMVAIPSPSFSEDAVCTHICNWLTDKGIIYKRAGNNIIAALSWQKTQDEHLKDKHSEGHSHKPTLMLCAHIDTVAPCEGYTFDPYRPEDCPGNMVQGLGSNDDGASVVSMIAAFRYFMAGHGGAAPGAEAWENAPLARAAMTDAHDLLLVLSCEEERSGMNGMTGLWPQIKDQIDFAIIGEPTGMKAATSERGLLVIDATAHGISGHAARNEGINAIEIALEDIQALKYHEFVKVSPLMGKVNLNVTQINAGTAHNVIPDICTFVIDIRPTEQYTNEEILKELQAICKSDLKARNLSNRSSACRENSPLQQAVEKMGIGTFSSPTTSDWMRIDCDAIKMGPGESSRSHKKDEFVFIDEIAGGIRTYIDFINGFFEIIL